MSRNIFSFHGSAALVAGTALSLVLTGCVGDMPHSGGWVADSHNKRVQMAYGIPETPRSHSAPLASSVLPGSPLKALARQPAGRSHPRRP